LVIGFTLIGVTVGIWAGHGLFRRIQVSLRRRGLGITRLLVVGTGETSRSTLSRIKANPGLGYHVVGVVAEKSGKRVLEGVRVVGTLPELPGLLGRLKVAEVLFALPAASHAQLLPQLVRLQDSPVKYKIVSDLFGIITNPVETDVLLGIPVFEMKEAPLNRLPNRLLKRSFDILFSLSGLLLLTIVPILPLVALLVKATSPGPVFYRQKRLGKDGKTFRMFKFRSMVEGSDRKGLTRKGDARITAVGRILRRVSLDELPQLFNVLLGQMSLVGPRPEVVGHEYGPSIPRYFERHPVKPGITGWAQVNGFRGDSSLDERVKYDIFYIENWSLWLDIKIILRTVLDILEHRHAY
jgi:Undecaprenyl-phosphate glucose phosphotransferase